MRPLILGTAISLLAAIGSDYQSSVEKWRQQYQASLQAQNGWLSVAGLFWLHEGKNLLGSDPGSDIVLPPSAPAHAGSLEFHDGRTSLRVNPALEVTVNGKPATAADLKPDTEASPDTVTLGTLQLTVIKRGQRYGVRVRDPESRARREFTGLHWFPVNETYRIKAKFVSYDPPKMLPITNILGDTEPEKCPGYAEFTLAGRTVRLEPVIEGPTLFFMFKDQTAAKETYASGRFLNTDMPKDGEVVLDFNKAHNPPCAFTSFATCPLPPRQNHVAVRIEAGEKKYGIH